MLVSTLDLSMVGFELTHHQLVLRVKNLPIAHISGSWNLMLSILLLLSLLVVYTLT